MPEVKVNGWCNSTARIRLYETRELVEVTTINNYLDHFGLENANASFNKQQLADFIQELTDTYAKMKG